MAQESLDAQIWQSILGLKDPTIYWRVRDNGGADSGFRSGTFTDLRTLQGATKRLFRRYPNAQEVEVRFTPFN